MPSMSFYVAILTHHLSRVYYSDDAAEREGINASERYFD